MHWGLPAGEHKTMKVVFLDRDGVINQYPGRGRYVTTLEDFIFLPGSIEAIKMFKEYGFKVFCISNQAGVAKGLYSRSDLNAITDYMLQSLRAHGTDIDGVYYCLHQDKDLCSCRKPKPGLIRKAFQQERERPSVCFVVGDSFRDMLAARASGCKSVLVLSGEEKEENKDCWQFMPDYVFCNLLEAARVLCHDQK